MKKTVIKMDVSQYYYELCEKANDCRRRWGLNENDPIDIFTVVQNKIENLSIVFINMDGDISGSSKKTKNQTIIFINATHSYGRQRFTLAHELYHLLYEDAFVISSTISESENEEMANQFASCLLMSNGALLNYERENEIKEWDLDNIIKTEQYFQISHKAMLRRLKMLGKIDQWKYDKYLPGITYEAEKRGYEQTLYEPHTHKKNKLIGNYIRLTNMAFEDKKISKGKRDEFLLDAFVQNTE